MLDHAFHRRKEIERMLLAGNRLKVSELTKMFGVGKDAIRRDFDILGESLPIVTKRGQEGGFYLMSGPGRYQNILSVEQLKCLEEIMPLCTEDQKITLHLLIRELGPYVPESDI